MGTISSGRLKDVESIRVQGLQAWVVWLQSPQTTLQSGNTEASKWSLNMHSWCSLAVSKFHHHRTSKQKLKELKFTSLCLGRRMSGPLPGLCFGDLFQGVLFLVIQMHTLTGKILVTQGNLIKTSSMPFKTQPHTTLSNQPIYICKPTFQALTNHHPKGSENRRKVTKALEHPCNIWILMKPYTVKPFLVVFNRIL